MLHVVGTSRLADAVHAQLWVAQVEGTDARLGREHRTDGTAARGVVPHDEELQRDGGDLGRLLQQDDARRVGGVPLVSVDLDDGALVHLGRVVALVFCGVVGVNRVGHVGRDEERRGERLLKGRGRGRVIVALNLVIRLIARGVVGEA